MDYINILYVFAGIGVLDTLYLIWHKINKTDVACPFFPKEWCRKVQYAKQSKTLGIPNSILGFLMYVAILVLTWLYVSASIAFWPIKAVVLIGFLFSMYFTYVQAFVLKAFCTWCVISTINFTVMFAVTWLF
ncbi:MAG: vitamin K epoxide reductase family protein [Patescibacteria group bacterium]